MRDNYEACLAITLKWEGGDVDHPADPGGKTRWGVTQAVYSAWRKAHGKASASVFSMTKPEMLAIYKENYWDAVKGDNLAYGVDLATWDFGVNSGPARARNILLTSIGGTDIQTIQKICAKRLSFVQGLKIWKTFGKGWSRRIADIEARAVKMAAPRDATKASVHSILTIEATKAAESAKSAVAKAKITGGAAGASGVSASIPDMDQIVALSLLGIAAVAIIILIFYARNGQHDVNRAEAYKKASEGTE